VAKRDEPLLQALSAEALARICEAEPQGLANMAWAFAVLAFRHRPLLAAIATAASSALEPRGGANIAWAFASMAFRHAPFFMALSRYAGTALGQFQPQSLSNTAWSLAELRCRDDRPFLNAIADEISRRGVPEMLEGRHGYAVLWAAWVTGEGGRELLEEAYRSAAVLLPSSSALVSRSS